MPKFHRLDTTPTTFPQFTSLPPELQLVIWEHAIVKPWQADQAWQNPEDKGLFQLFKHFTGPWCMHSCPCCIHCTPWWPSRNIVGSSGIVAYFGGTSYEKWRYMMFDAMSVSRTTRLFVLKWWKRKIDGEVVTEKDVDGKKELVTAFGKLIEDTESRIRNEGWTRVKVNPK